MSTNRALLAQFLIKFFSIPRSRPLAAHCSSYIVYALICKKILDEKLGLDS